MQPYAGIEDFASRTSLKGFTISAEGGITYHWHARFRPLIPLQYLPYPIDNAEASFPLCYLPDLEDLRNTPFTIKGRLTVSGCEKLTDWTGSRIESCGTLDILGSGCRIGTLTGGPKTVADEIFIPPDDFDMYELPTGTWKAVYFEHTSYTPHSQDYLRGALAALKALPIENIPLVLASRSATPLVRWIAKRLLEGLDPFANFH